MSSSTAPQDSKLGICSCGVGCSCAGSKGEKCTCNSAEVQAKGQEKKAAAGCDCGKNCVCAASHEK
ncbi:hypothetical protein HKX48_004269 [Thoreauomyces humboldtii]|nr:hypothetical protein HKX48_004269 [Thoreauomyces humboldtii]